MTTSLTVPLGDMPADARSSFLDAVLEDFQTKPLKEIAKARKMSPITICRYLLSEKPEEWKLASAAKALLEYEAALVDLKDSSDMFKVNKAEKMVKAMQWQLERTQRRIYGANPADGATLPTVSINIGIIRNSEEKTISNGG